jgi:hypothetical protein
VPATGSGRVRSVTLLLSHLLGQSLGVWLSNGFAYDLCSCWCFEVATCQLQMTTWIVQIDRPPIWIQMRHSIPQEIDSHHPGRLTLSFLFRSDSMCLRDTTQRLHSKSFSRGELSISQEIRALCRAWADCPTWAPLSRSCSIHSLAGGHSCPNSAPEAEFAPSWGRWHSPMRNGQ